MADPNLSGCTVWLTRPASRAAVWRDALSAAGATVIVEPLLAIAPSDDEATAAGQLDRAERADYVIATSANAVAGLARLRPGWRPQGALIAVGSATADALAEQAGRAVRTPATASSEGLLAMPELADITEQTVAILAGHGGRAALAESLSARGARVAKLALYRRRPADIGPARLDELLDVSNMIVVTSVESWHNLIGRLSSGQKKRLGQLGLAAASRRLVQQSGDDVDWSVKPAVIEPMHPDGALIALDRIWSALRS